MHGCRAELTPREGQAADSVLRMLGAIQRASREIWEPAALAASPQRDTGAWKRTRKKEKRKEVEQERWVVWTSVSHLKWQNMSKIKKNN